MADATPSRVRAVFRYPKFSGSQYRSHTDTPWPQPLHAAYNWVLRLVRDSLELIEEAFAADRNLLPYLGRFRLQKTIYDANYGLEGGTNIDYGSEWPILNPQPFKAFEFRGVQQQMILLIRTLFDPEELWAKYGLRIERLGIPQPPDELAIEIKYITDYLYKVDSRYFSWALADRDLVNEAWLRHLDFIKTIRFVVSGAPPKMDEFILRLEEFNRMLQFLTPRQMMDCWDRQIFELVAKDVVKVADRGKQLEEAATHEAKYCIDEPARANYDDLSKLANFTFAIDSAEPHVDRRKVFRLDDMSFDTPYYIDKNSTLARLFDYPTKHQSRLVLVEWITLTGLETLDETKTTWYVLHAVKPEKLLLPATIGFFHDESSPRTVGLVFQLPPHIRGNLPTKPAFGRPGEPGGRVVRSPKTIAAERMPTTLRQLILQREPKGVALDVRFKIAKQLVDALHLMHTARFTHRNIRSSNILFFPAPSIVTDNNEPDPWTLDYTNPLLFGFHDAPLEITLTPPSDQPPPAYTQPEGLKPILKKPKGQQQPPPRDVVIDCYTHPERRLHVRLTQVDSRHNPPPSYRRQYDLWSVGCVLLELGLWETLENVCGREIAARAPLVGDYIKRGVTEEEVWADAETVRRAAKGLDVITGTAYAEITRICLEVKPVLGDIVEFERRIAAALAQIGA
ncbi:hypothetical protein C8A01DRAFT_50932 [Parachaetomium inaequale]|uniref:Protein kinase domain-containing protein n=1 Tax=Parachaetomium inaequale TaxID=2588326 RepID=A0AAN6P5P8_9PEZI|nr:hypothetical protein C8A01DRAFT_50932 [Parachaetomium inaequale]